MWAWHLEFVIGISRDCHEFGIEWPLEYDIVWTLEVNNFKGGCPRTILVTKHDRKSNCTERHNLMS